MLQMGELRSLLERFTASNGLEVIPRSLVVNNTDPEAFNYSLEDPIMRHYGSYLEFDHDWSFSTVQPFIRPTDFSELVRGNPHRQSVFDVGAIRFSLGPDNGRRRELHALALGELVRFLTEEVGLDQDLFIFTVFGGGRLVEAAEANGRQINLADPSLTFLPDSATQEILLDLGFLSNQLRVESNLDTFLAEFPMPIEAWAGYRSEIYYDDLDLGPIEIGTDECLYYRRLIWSDEEIRGPKTSLSVTKDIVPHEGTFAASGIGLERVLMVANGLATPYECDHIAPVFETGLALAKADADEQAARVLTDALRVLQLVTADGFGYADLPTKHIKNQWRAYACQLDRCLVELGIDDGGLAELAAVNAASQPWYGELSGMTIPRLLEEIRGYRERVARS